MATAGFRYHFRIFKTLLTRPPREDASFWTLVSTFLLFGGCGLYWSDSFGASLWMPASRRVVFEEGHVWALATTLFAHADLGHLFSNAFLYAILGYLLNGYFGPTIFPIAAWLLALPMTALALLTYSAQTQLIGASGLVHLMAGMWLSLYFFLSRNLRLTQRLLRSMGVMLALFFPMSFEPQISYRVHFIGLAMGLCAGAIYFRMFRRRLQAFEEVDIEYEPEPAIQEAIEKGGPNSREPSEWTGFEDWEDVSELEGPERLTDDDLLSDDEDWDEIEEDEDPASTKKPRRLGPSRGKA